MASQFSIEDQTDEDFFDKLVEDEFSGTQPGSNSKELKREYSNLSVDSDGSDNVSTGTEPTKRLSNPSSDDKDPAFEKPEISNLDDLSNKDAEVPDLALEESPNEGTNDEFLEKKGEEIGLGLSNSPVEKSSTGPKGTSVKQVQWSVFGSGPDLFGSESDPFESEGFTDPVTSSFQTQSIHASSTAQFYQNQSFVQTQDLNQSSYSNQNDDDFFNNPEPVQSEPVHAEPVQVDPNEIANFENQYPGWKFDYVTGNWYQVDNLDSNSNAQFDNSNLSSDVSYIQQSTHPVLETIAEESTGTVNTVTGTEYPPNMIFDAQYPGYYFDTNTQEWYTLVSYTPVPQQTNTSTGTGTGQQQVNQEVNASSNVSIPQTQNETQLGQLLASQDSTGEWSSYLNNQNPNPNLSESIYNDNTSSSNNALMSSYYGDQTSVPTSSSFYAENTSIPIPTNSQISQSLYRANSTVGGNFVTNDLSNSSYGNTSNNQNYYINSNNNNNVAANQGFTAFTPVTTQGQFGQNNLSDSFYGNRDVGPTQTNLSESYYADQSNLVNKFQSMNIANYSSQSQFSYNPNEGRSSAGRPPHTLVTFGFGGKLLIMKDSSSSSYSSPYDFSNKSNEASGTVTMHNIWEIVKEKAEDPNITDQQGVLSYFKALSQQSFPGPLVGSSVASKEVNKWLDERISSCESSQVDSQKGEYSKLLLSLLKILCQHYGKLRSPFGSDPSQQEADGPEMAVTKLFSSAKRNNFGSFGNCMNSIPSESQMRATALEVQNLLVSGKRKEALHHAQDGQLWGPALVLAAQLGDSFYADTVKKMAQRQFVIGSPIRTLCLLIAGQPADVFSTDNPNQSALGTPKYAVPHAQQPFEFQGGGMLDEWEENLAIMAANRTNSDPLVMVHLGDCLWKEKGEVMAAHTCYLVAESNFEFFSDTARLCLLGADHWKCPRTFASPEAIQRTELYEYAKVQGNAQFMLLPFQPYKLVYAHMLAEMGKLADSLKYCQASLKLLKSSRAPEWEALKQQFSSLEERIKTHQQGGYNSSAPKKMVTNLMSTFDRSLQRVMGTPAQTQPAPGLPPLAPTGTGTGTGTAVNESISKFSNSKSVNVMSTLVPSSSSESMHDWAGDSSNNNNQNNQNNNYNNINNNNNSGYGGVRNISSESDITRSPKKGGKENETVAGGSKLGVIGSKLFGWIGRPKNQAKLGDENKLYYDANLKTWVEKGATATAEAPPPLAPPPTTASFHPNGPSNNTSYNNLTNMQTETTHNMANSMMPPVPDSQPSYEPTPAMNSMMPPVPPSHNQFASRGRVGVRSRYVDTFNKGGTAQAAPKNQFHSPAAPTAIKPPANAKFFVPTVPVSTGTPEQTGAETPPVYNSPPPYTEESSLTKQPSFSSSASNSSPPPRQNYHNTPPSASSSSTIQRFNSMDTINKTPANMPGSADRTTGNKVTRNRAASWSGSYNDPLGGRSAHSSPPSVHMNFMPTYNNNSSSSLQDEFNEVEL